MDDVFLNGWEVLVFVLGRLVTQGGGLLHCTLWMKSGWDLGARTTRAQRAGAGVRAWDGVR